MRQNEDFAVGGRLPAASFYGIAERFDGAYVHHHPDLQSNAVNAFKRSQPKAGAKANNLAFPSGKLSGCRSKSCQALVGGERFELPTLSV